MAHKPLVSIIVPVYRTPIHLLKRFLKSALNQTIPDIELIAVDDASPDDCPGILDILAKNDPRMVVHHRKTNGRAGMARCDGLRLAQGHYVLFADADDELKPEMCEKLTGLAERFKADIAACSWIMCDDSGKNIGERLLPEKLYDLNSNWQRAKCYSVLNPALWNKIFRRERIKNLSFEQFEINIGEDTLFNIAALCQSSVMVMTRYTGYMYSIHAGSVTGKSEKGLPYLKTLAISGKRIRDLLHTEDDTWVGRRYADRLAFNRFTGGCRWIADQSDAKEKKIMWDYWQAYLKEELVPDVKSCVFLAYWYRLIVSLFDVHTVYRLTHIVSRLTDIMLLSSRLDSYSGKGLLRES